MFYLAVKIKRLVNVAQPSTPSYEMEQSFLDHLIRSMSSVSLWRHLLTADTYTVTGIVLAIEQNLFVGGADHSACKAARETDDLEQLVHSITNLRF